MLAGDGRASRGAGAGRGVRTFDAFHLAGGPEREPEPSLERTPVADGMELAHPDLDRAGADAVLEGVAKAGAALRQMTNDEVVTAIGHAAARLLDPDDALRIEAEEWLPAEAGLSLPMARLVLERMAADWSADASKRLLQAEFADPGVLEGFRPGAAGGQVRAMGDEVAFHVGAGTVPGVGATSIVRSLLVRTPVLLKPGRGDVILPVLLARAVAAETPVLGGAIAVAYWPGGSGPPLETRALAGADRVVVYGGTDTVEAIRARLPAGTPMVSYPHRISAGAVGRELLVDEAEARRVARDAAEAVAAYDQRGCVSPHLVWIEEGAPVAPARWAELLAEELDALEERLPPGPVDHAVAARVQQLRGAARMRAAADPRVRVLTPGHGETSWTVLVETGGELEAGCTGRLVRVRPIPELERLPELLAPWRPLLQSMGLAAERERRTRLALRLSDAGVSRVTSFQRQPWPTPWWTHDGQGPLRILVRWATLEEP